MFANRRNRLKKELEGTDVCGVIVDSSSNLYYYTGFTGGEAMLVMLFPDSYLITDSRYYEQVEKECPYIPLIRLTDKGYSDTIQELFAGKGLLEKQACIAIEGSILDIHEEPRFSPKCDVTARENMVITVEPGIYLPGKFGVRIEDLVVVKKTGYEKLSHSDKSLIIL